MKEPTQEFKDFLSSRGVLPSDIYADGIKRRCSTADKPTKDNVEYCLHPESPTGWYNGYLKNYQTQEYETFGCRGEKVTTAKDEQELERLQQAIEAQKANANKKRQEQQAQTALRAQAIWKAGQPASSHPYLSRKQIDGQGLKTLSGPELLRLHAFEIKKYFPDFSQQMFLIIPFYSIDRELVNVQLIAGQKNDKGQDKLFLKHGQKQGAFFVLTPHDTAFTSAKTAYICEGVSTGKSIVSATQTPVVVCFDAFNLGHVVPLLRNKFPEKELILCADNDAFTVVAGKPLNTGIVQATIVSKTHKLRMVVPEFTSQDGEPTDFNDLHTREGIEAVTRQIVPPNGTQQLPIWNFWEYTIFKDQVNIHIDPLKYLAFLADSQFRIFNKRGVPTVVEETEDSMNKTIVRGKVNTTVKTVVITSLLDAGFDDVAGHFIMNPKYFTIDTLESLPLIPDEKAQKSIFSEQETEITLATQFVKEDPLISFDESPILSPGNTLAIVGRQGLGKSGVCELFVSMALSQECEPFSPFESHPQGGLVLWIDTERTSNDMLTALHRIVHRTQADTPEYRHLLNDDNTSFARLQVERCGGIEDKMTWLLEKLEVIQEPLDLVVIDGALDLVDSMNDEADAKHFFDDIQMITDKKQCGVILTIHSAPNDENGKGMGHIGSIIMRKSSSFLQIRNSADDKTIKELSTDFTHAKMRHGKDWGVYAAIQWDEDEHMLHFIDYIPPEAKPRVEKAKEDAREAFEWIFQKERWIKFTALKTRYAQHTHKTERTAKNHIKKAVEDWGILTKDNDIYTLCH